MNTPFILIVENFLDTKFNWCKIKLRMGTGQLHISYLNSGDGFYWFCRTVICPLSPADH